MSFKEFRASLRLNKITKNVLLRIVAILFPSASKTAQRKAIKMAQNAISRKISRKAKRKTKSKGKRKVKKRAKGKRKTKRKTKSKRKKKGKQHFSSIKVPLKGGGSRRQRVLIMASGKRKFVKNK